VNIFQFYANYLGCNFYLILFIILDVAVLTYGAGLIIGAFFNIAPPTPSNSRLQKAVTDYIAREYPDAKTILDIGSGGGVLATAVAKNMPGAKVMGVEIMPIPYLESILRGIRVRNLKFVFGNVFKFLKKNPQKFDIGITYLLPVEMKHVREFLSRFDVLVVLDFALPDVEPYEKIKLHKGFFGQHWLYIYKS
jgi:SAM-dependent methyltransferase